MTSIELTTNLELVTKYGYTTITKGWCRKIEFLIGELGLCIRVMRSTSELDYKGFILIKLSGLKLEWWGSFTLTCSLIKSYFWRSKRILVGMNVPDGSKKMNLSDANKNYPNTNSSTRSFQWHKFHFKWTPYAKVIQVWSFVTMLKNGWWCGIHIVDISITSW